MQGESIASGDSIASGTWLFPVIYPSPFTIFYISSPAFSYSVDTEKRESLQCPLRGDSPSISDESPDQLGLLFLRLNASLPPASLESSSYQIAVTPLSKWVLGARHAPRSVLEGLTPTVQSESQGMQTTGWSRVPRRAGEDESPLEAGEA